MQRNFDIGIKTRGQTTGEKESASDRIRARMIVAQLENIEIYKPDTRYGSLIFHQIDFAGLRKHKGLSLFDICDYTWDLNENVFLFAQEVDVVTVASQPLKDKLIQDGLETPICVIGDGHNLENRLEKRHKEVAEKVVWFGYFDNQHCLDNYYGLLKELGLKLRIISEHNGRKGDEFFEWNIDTANQLINECDFAVLPKNGPYKTNNKDVTAWLSGLPVAKTEEDIRNFISKEGRLNHLVNVDVKQYNIVDRAWDYNNICVEFSDLKQRGIIQKSS